MNQGKHTAGKVVLIILIVLVSLFDLFWLIGTIGIFLEGEDGRPCEWTLSIQVDGENVTFKAQSEDGQQSPEEGLS